MAYHQDIGEWHGKTLVDRDGERIGKLEGGRSLARAIGRHERDIRRRASRWHIWPHGTQSRPPAPASARRSQ